MGKGVRAVVCGREGVGRRKRVRGAGGRGGCCGGVGKRTVMIGEVGGCAGGLVG